MDHLGALLFDGDEVFEILVKRDGENVSIAPADLDRPLFVYRRRDDQRDEMGQ